MSLDAKALVVVLALALLTFNLCKPIAIGFMREETFRRRRNVWIAITTVAFLSPSFWVWAGFTFIVAAWAARKDASPLSLFCVLAFAVPHVSVPIPAPIVNQLFDLSPTRVLLIAILLPAAIATRGPAETRTGSGTLNVVLLVFLLLQVLLLVPYETVTHTMRRATLLALDVFLVVYVFSRLGTREHLADVLACFWLSGMLLAAVGVFESLRGWLLYIGIPERWGDPNVFAWLMRGGELRAQASANHSITYGYLVAMTLGIALYLHGRASAKPWRQWAVLGVLATGTIVSYSRGAWLAAALAVVVFVLLRPDARKSIGTTMGVGVATIAVLFLTPLKEKVVDRLPFIGTAEQDTISYRQQLAETSWELVNQHPWLGDPFVAVRMGSLKQGQGIIDIVNAYLFTALFNGYVGLSLLCVVLALPLVLVWKARRRIAAADRDFSSMSAALIACMIATLVFIATSALSTTSYVLCGLLVSAAGIGLRAGNVSWPSVGVRTLRAQG